MGQSISKFFQAKSEPEAFDVDAFIFGNAGVMVSQNSQSSAQSSASLCRQTDEYLQYYIRGGDINSLYHAISSAREAVEATDAHDADRARRLYHLGYLYNLKFKEGGMGEDSDAQISWMESAFAVAAPEDPNRKTYIRFLFDALLERFSRQRAIDDLDFAIFLGEELTPLLVEDVAGLGCWLNALATAYERRFMESHKQADLENSIESGQRAVTLTQRDDSMFPIRQHSLAIKFELLFRNSGRTADLEKAIQTMESATSAAAKDHAHLKALNTYLQALLELRQSNVTYFSEPAIVTEIHGVEALSIYQKVYSPLPLGPNKTRLLSIGWSRDPSGHACLPLACTLRVIDLKRRPPYVALSYTWGSQAFDNTVICNGEELSVTRSCAEALLALLKQGCSEVWIDQLSIDQSDLQERGQQVELMHKIYAGARSVYIWLGRLGYNEWLENQDIDVAISSTDAEYAHMSRQTDSNPALWWKIMTWLKAEGKNHKMIIPSRSRWARMIMLMRHIAELDGDHSMAKDEIILSNEWAWIYLADLTARAYFQRRWTIQEHQVSEDVHILMGEEIVAWIPVWSAITAVWHEKQADMSAKLKLPIPEPCKRFWMITEADLDHTISISDLRRFRQVSKGDNIQIPFLEVMRMSKSARTKVSHDKIYALLSLVADRHIFPAVDYTQNVADIFKSFIKALIDKGDGQKVLVLSGHKQQHSSTALVRAYRPSWRSTTPELSQLGANDVDEAPSWCPHFLWQPLPTSYPLSWSHYFPSMLPKAAGSTAFNVRMYADSNRLIVAGAIIDTISAIQHQTTRASDRFSMARRGHVVAEFITFHQFAQQHTAQSINPARIDRKATRKIITLTNEDTSFQERHLQRLDTWQKLDLALCILQYLDANTLSGPLYGKLSHYVGQSALKENGARVLCATTAGYLGVCSSTPQIGDRVAVIQGLGLLMVLRPVVRESTETTAEEACFEVIGDAYFAGLGYGGALKLKTYRPGEIVLQ